MHTANKALEMQPRCAQQPNYAVPCLKELYSQLAHNLVLSYDDVTCFDASVSCT